MAMKRYADVVCPIKQSNGFTRYVRVGTLLQSDNNDEKRGPGFILALDTTFNPAGAQAKDGSVFLSTYWPKAEEEGPKESRPRVRDLGQFDGDESDIPF